MTTLYDILGACPNDDAGTLKDAFRKAVKANHPDLNALDPDAPARFLQIVRAKSILSDPELRSLYDRMLDYERQQLRRPSKLTAIIDAVHNTVSDSIAIIILAVVLAGAYTVFSYISEMSVSKTKVVAASSVEAANLGAVPSPVNATASETGLHKGVGAEAPVQSAAEPAINGGVAGAMHEPAEIVDVRPPPPVDLSVELTASTNQTLEDEAFVPTSAAPTIDDGGAVESAVQETLAVAEVQPASPAIPTESDGSRDKVKSGNAAVPNTAAPIETHNIVGAIHADRSTSNVKLKDAKYYRARGVASYHNGDTASAIADFDLAIRLDSNFADAYIDRAVALYRMRQFDRAFADIAQASRIVKSRRTATAPIKQRLGLSE
jgi:tetratricopeptide (TPR) repeat protein